MAKLNKKTREAVISSGNDFRQKALLANQRKTVPKKGRHKTPSKEELAQGQMLLIHSHASTASRLDDALIWMKRTIGSCLVTVTSIFLMVVITQVVQ